MHVDTYSPVYSYQNIHRLQCCLVENKVDDVQFILVLCEKKKRRERLYNFSLYFVLSVVRPCRSLLRGFRRAALCSCFK